MQDNPYLTWFRRVMWLGIIANIGVAICSIAATQTVLEWLQLPSAQPVVWPRFAAFLLILLSIFYVPSALNPLQNRFTAVFAVICRFGGVAFFLIVSGGYIVFGLFDFVFGLPQAILLALGLHSARTR
jgi:hypothetical protein